MSVQLEIIRATEFVRVSAAGQFDLPASKEALATVAAACHKRGIQHAIVDLRALRPGPKPVFTTADLAALVNTFPEVGFTSDLRLAILYQSDPHRRARLFAFLSTMHGWQVRAFGDFETALGWLASDPEEASPAHGAASGRRIPIRIRGQKSDASRRSGYHTRPAESRRPA